MFEMQELELMLEAVIVDGYIITVEEVEGGYKLVAVRGTDRQEITWHDGKDYIITEEDLEHIAQIVDVTRVTEIADRAEEYASDAANYMASAQDAAERTSADRTAVEAAEDRIDADVNTVNAQTGLVRTLAAAVKSDKEAADKSAELAAGSAAAAGRSASDASKSYQKILPLEASTVTAAENAAESAYYASLSEKNARDSMTKSATFASQSESSVAKVRESANEAKDAAASAGRFADLAYAYEKDAEEHAANAERNDQHVTELVKTVDTIAVQANEPGADSNAVAWVDTDETDGVNLLTDVDIDATLTRERRVAEAKAVGDKIAQVRSEAAAMKEELEGEVGELKTDFNTLQELVGDEPASEESGLELLKAVSDSIELYGALVGIIENLPSDESAQELVAELNNENDILSKIAEDM